MSQVFPVYLKYKNHKTWFKVISATEFQELKQLGKYFNLRKYSAQTLPDRNFIADLLFNHNGNMEPITSNEFEDQLEYCYLHLKEKQF